MCPDFATGGNEARPMKANSQTARVIAALAGGWKGHIGELSNTIHTLNPKARLSEARTWLASNGITLKDEYRQLGEARVKYYWLEPLDQVVAWERLKKATERKKQCLYRIRGFTASV